MKRIRYTKYVPDPAGEMSLEDLLGALSDYLLQSGFQDYLSYYDLPNGEQTLDDLKRAIERALLESEMLNDQMREQLQQMQAEGSLDELIDKLIERMQQEDYISIDQPHDPSQRSSVGGQVGEAQQQSRFEITDKSLDFLGYKTLRDLLGSLGKSSFGPTTRAIWRPESKPAALRGNMNLATPSISTSPLRFRAQFNAKA